MLSTDKATWPNCIWLGGISQQLRVDHSYDYSPRTIDPIDDSMLPQHLYILSDEWVNKGDYFYGTNKLLGEGIFQCDKGLTDDGYPISGQNYFTDCKKVIASTNTNLMVGFKDGSGFYTMPLIPQSFIDKYVSEYNKGHKIEEVLVEYEMADGGNSTSDEWGWVINSDNTINTKPTKDFWTRDEVCYLLHAALWTNPPCNEIEATEWIESNL
jgi:hypothetical protein